MDYEATLCANLALGGTLVFRDAQGNVVGTTGIRGSIPLTTPEQVEEAQALINAQGAHDGQLRE